MAPLCCSEQKWCYGRERLRRVGTDGGGCRCGGALHDKIRFMTRWHRGEAEKSWLRHAAAVDAKSSDKGKPGGRGGGAGRGAGSRTDAAVDECRNELVDRVARYRFD